MLPDRLLGAPVETLFEKGGAIGLASAGEEMLRAALAARGARLDAWGDLAEDNLEFNHGRYDLL